MQFLYTWRSKTKSKVMLIVMKRTLAIGVIMLIFSLTLTTTNVSGLGPGYTPMTMEQIDSLLKEDWKIDEWGNSYSLNLITAHADEIFYIEGDNVELRLRKNDKKTYVYPVGLGVYAEIFKDDLIIPPFGSGDVNESGAYKIKMYAPSEVGYYKINVYSGFSFIDIFGVRQKLISYSRTLYVESSPTPTPTPTSKDSDSDGWTDDQEIKAGTDPMKRDTDNDGYWDPQDQNPLDPTIPKPALVDSDGDGVLDEHDYAPWDPQVQTKSDIRTPGFEVLFAIAGLLAVTYLLRKVG